MGVGSSKRQTSNVRRETSDVKRQTSNVECEASSLREFCPRCGARLRWVEQPEHPGRIMALCECNAAGPVMITDALPWEDRTSNVKRGGDNEV
jgi:hypothetical protein